MAQFVLKVKDIDADGRSYDLSIPRAWLARELDGTDVSAGPDDGRAQLYALRQGDDIVVTGRVDGTLIVPCVRCLEDARLEVSSDVGALFTAKGEGRRELPGEDDLTPEELARELYSGDEIVLDELVREQLILEVPMQPLCREDCPGIDIPAHVKPPADFGAKTDDDVDPRLAPLKDIAVAKQEEKLRRESDAAAPGGVLRPKAGAPELRSGRLRRPQTEKE